MRGTHFCPFYRSAFNLCLLVLVVYVTAVINREASKLDRWLFIVTWATKDVSLPCCHWCELLSNDTAIVCVLHVMASQPVCMYRFTTRALERSRPETPPIPLHLALHTIRLSSLPLSSLLAGTDLHGAESLHCH